MSGQYRPIQSPKLQRESGSSEYEYREYAPNEKLASHVACYWTMDFDPGRGSRMHRILPDGCVDIIVDRRALSPRKAAFVEGLMATYEVLRFAEAQSLFGIRLFTESAPSLLRYPISAFIGQHVYIEEIWGTDGLFMVEEMLLAHEAPRIVEIADRKLIDRLSARDAPAHPLIYASMKEMYASKGSLSTADLADRVSFSERHLRRTFDRELGLSPKEMLGIVRFQSLLQDLYDGLYQGARSGFADLAAKYGYYDQSHFIKSFKRYYGMLPGQLARTDPALPDIT